MNAEHLPPRPDRLHPIPPPPPATSHETSPRPRATWSLWEALGVYLLAFVLAGVATVPVVELVDDEDLATVAASVVAATVIVVVLVLWLSVAHPAWRRVMGFPARGARWREIRGSIGFGLLLYPSMVLGVGLVLGLLLSIVSGSEPAPPEQVPSGLPPIGVALTVVYALVVAPVHEELFFRGIVFRGVRDRYGLAAGLVASGIGFGLIHYVDAPWQDAVLLMGVMLFNGIAIAWWYERRGTILAPLVVHTVFNAIGLTLIFTVQGV
jgi:membrane protease YdiL (CAAX protease family)